MVNFFKILSWGNPAPHGGRSGGNGDPMGPPQVSKATRSGTQRAVFFWPCRGEFG